MWSLKVNDLLRLEWFKNACLSIPEIKAGHSSRFCVRVGKP